MIKCYLIVWSVERKQKVRKKVRTRRLQRQKKAKPVLLSKCAVCDNSKNWDLSKSNYQFTNFK